MRRVPSTNGADRARSTATPPVTRAVVPVPSGPPRARAKPRTRAGTADERSRAHTSMMQIAVAPASTQLRSARSAVRSHLGREHYGTDEIRAVAAVVNELLGAALDGGVHEQLELSVES